MLYSRKILQKIDKWLLEKEIIILNGPRQVGKTSLLKLIKANLIEKGISKNNIFYLNLENINILDELNSDPMNILKYITDKSQKNYFLIDEIQYLDKPSNFLKYLFDEYSTKIKLIVTGSSSLELKADLQDSLAGRKISFLVRPLNFEEFLQFKKSKVIKYLSQTTISLDIKKSFDKELNEYLIYGGMPAIVLQDDLELKQKMLFEYVNTYVNKDIRMIGKIENISQFNKVVKVLASQIGTLLNVSDLSNTTDITRRNIEKYLDLLEYTFVLNKVSAFFKNVKKQIIKMPKIYFFDVGIRNAILNNFIAIENRQDKGELFENFIFLELVNNTKNQVFFYRTISKSEIDFVVDNGKELSLVEVKYKDIKKEIDTRVLRGFKEQEGKKKRCFVVSRNRLELEGDVEYIDYRNLSNVIEGEYK